jgi:predicted RNA-binding protein with PIN domain
MTREFGEDKHPFYRYSHNKTPSKPDNVEYNTEVRKKYVIIDGYNVIFAWDDLKEIAKENLGIARDKLLDILCNYSAFTKCEAIVVFDAYKVSGNNGQRFNYNNIRVVYTKERELGDNYIEKLISDIGKNDNVRVVTSDNLIQLSAVRFGVLRVSAQDFKREVDAVEKNIEDFLFKVNKPRPHKVGELVEFLLEN